MIDILPEPMRLNEYTIRAATTQGEVDAYLDALEHARIYEQGLKYYRASSKADFERIVYLLSFCGDKIVGGVQIVKPAAEPFVFGQDLVPQEAIPDWQALRRWGNIGELSSLFLNEAHKAKMDMAAVNQYLLATARMLGISHLICNAWLFNKVALLYGALGFYAISELLLDVSARVSEEDTTPNAMIMLGPTMPGLAMPPQAQKLSLPQLMQLCRQYERV